MFCPRCSCPRSLIGPEMAPNDLTEYGVIWIVRWFFASFHWMVILTLCMQRGRACSRGPAVAAAVDPTAPAGTGRRCCRRRRPSRTRWPSAGLLVSGAVPLCSRVLTRPQQWSRLQRCLLPRSAVAAPVARLQSRESAPCRCTERRAATDGAVSWPTARLPVTAPRARCDREPWRSSVASRACWKDESTPARRESEVGGCGCCPDRECAGQAVRRDR
jgi:hypothetical protein